ETLSLNEAGSLVDSLFQSPHFARLTGLQAINTHIPPRSIRLLAESPHASSLTDLEAGYYGLQPTAVWDLVQSQLFSRLTRLSLRNGAVLAARLVASIPHVHEPVRLRELNLTETGLSNAQVERLFCTGVMRELHRLSLVSCRSVGMESFTQIPMENLYDLDLSG